MLSFVFRVGRELGLLNLIMTEQELNSSLVGVYSCETII